MISFASRCLTNALVLFISLIVLLPAAVGQANLYGQWSTLPNTMPINPIHVALLSNGKVLVIAGSGNCSPVRPNCPSGPPFGQSNNAGALLWDPVSGQVTNQFSLTWDMFCNGMVLLPDGRPLIDGGTILYDPFTGSSQAAIFDPATNTFSDTPNMAHGRWYPTVLTLGDGRVMTFSGLDENSKTNPAVEFYTVGSGWSPEYRSAWNPDMYPRLHLLPNGKVLYSGSQTRTRLFDPSTATWNFNVASTNYSGTRFYGTSVLLPLTPANNYDPRVIIMGGGNPATNTTEVIDMGASTPVWQYGPTMSQARVQMNAVILPTGKVLAVGGSANNEDTTTASLNADLYDPASNSFSSAGANSYPRLYHSVALLLPDATVWLAGGNPVRGSYVQQMEIYQPAYLFNPDGTTATRPSVTSAPSSISSANNFSITTPDAANISSVVLVRNGTVTHAFGMDQREVGLSFTATDGVLTVTPPPNGNIAPPGYYMLFILNNSGVPSVAKFVQLTTGTSPSDFSVSATPSPQTIAPTTHANYTVTVTPSNGFTGNVSFGVSGLPAGATASFGPTTVSGSGSSILTVRTSSSTPAGTYTLTITAQSGTLSHSTQVTLNVADFAISVSPSSQTVLRGSNTTYTVTITPLGPFSGTVNLAIGGLPTRTSMSLNPTSVVGSGSSTLKISVGGLATPGTYPLTIKGSAGGFSHNTSVNLVIQ